VKPTDVKNPSYFHKVVDCQWACPAHTPVPEYIRLIAEGRYSDAYMINWRSNVFPGILGRTCDRPCEPACRRVRVEKEPVVSRDQEEVLLTLVLDHELPRPALDVIGSRTREPRRRSRGDRHANKSSSLLRAPSSVVRRVTFPWFLAVFRLRARAVLVIAPGRRKEHHGGRSQEDRKWLAND
jgi:hypothetical protein